MPRIDPLQLLKCLSVLLSPEGGIMSREEVPRLVNLMTKFSKKLVSKCVYLLILKSTDVTLVDMFMASGGWLLIHTWLQEAMASSNWNLVQEVLELLLVTPVDSSRLRLNNIPKLVKTLSKRDDLGDVKEMAASLVNNWLAIVKNSAPPIQDTDKAVPKLPEISNTVEVIEEKKEVVSETLSNPPKVTNEIETVELPEPPVIDEEPIKMEVEDENNSSVGMIYKITVRDGKQVITKMVNSEDLDEKMDDIEVRTDLGIDDDKEATVEKTEVDEKELKEKKEDQKSKSGSGSSGKSSGSSNKKSSSSSRSSSSSKEKDKKHSSSSKHSSKSSSSSKDKEKERSRRDKDKENDKDKHKNNGAIKQSSSSSSSSKSSSSSSSIRDKDKEKIKKDSKESKEKQSEKDKDTLSKIKPATLDKIGRIPKKSVNSEEDKETKKKPSMSIEPKKKAEDRPKTVKIFNSKMRSTGLEEEVKPPPPRNAVKKPAPVIPPVLPFPVKRTSPPKDSLATPPEKKMKIEIPERVGAIKLIPPKPKPPVLLESDIFMDALTAATSKKEPKKKKRRLSMSKESPESSPTVPPSATSPIGLKNFSPANFYQDTLETTGSTEETKEERNEESSESKPTDDKIEEKEEKSTNEEVTSEVSEPSTRTNSDGLKGVLVYLKKKGPKRSIQWKEEKDLVEVRYFELDETERVNVSRPNFTDLAKMEMTHEREALLGRKLMNEDLMEPTTLWMIPYLVDQPELPIQPGCKSLEKDIQYAREKNILQALYFNKNLIPDSPAEPIPENHPMVDPVIIPLEDAESQNYDLRNTPWPEPKGMAPVEHQQPPQQQLPLNIPPMFPNIPGPFPNFNQMGPQGFPMQGPGFCTPNMMHNGPPVMMPNNTMNMMGNPNMNMGPPMDMMNQAPINPNMFVPNGPNVDNFNPMMNDNQNFPINYNQPTMFGPPNNNFNMDRGGHRGRGGFRRGHNNNSWGRNGPRGGNNWRNNRDDHRGGTGRICKNVKNHGYCRNIENCPFVHPN